METKVTNQKELINLVSAKLGTTKKSAKEFLDILADITYFELGAATADQDVTVKLFPGLSLKSEYVPAHASYNPANRGIVDVPGKIKARAKIGKQLKEAVNA